MAFFKVYKLSELPPSLEANSVYFVESADEETDLDIYVTDKTGATARSVLKKETVQTMINNLEQSLMSVISSTSIVIPSIKQNEYVYPTSPQFFSPFVISCTPFSPVQFNSPTVEGVNSVFNPITFLNKVTVDQVYIRCGMYLDGSIIEDVASLQIKIREYTNEGVVGDTIVSSDIVSISTEETDSDTKIIEFTLADTVVLNGNYWVEIICNYNTPINPEYIFYAVMDEGEHYAQWYSWSDDDLVYIPRVSYVANTGATAVPDLNVNMEVMVEYPKNGFDFPDSNYSFFIYFKEVEDE